MSSEDRYQSYDDLSGNEEERRDGSGDYRVEICAGDQRDSEIAILAPHGGQIEPYTSTIARESAGEDVGLYLFDQTKSMDNFSALHLTSTRFDEPRCLELVAEVRSVAAVHGKKESKNGIRIGERDDDLGTQIEGLRRC